MAQFEPNRPRHPNAGRKKGTKNHKHLPTVKESLAAAGKNPCEEILKLLPHLEPKDQVRYWMELLTYVESRAKTIEVIEQVSTQRVAQEIDDEELLKLA